MSWHPTLWFQDDGICWNGCLPSTSVFRGVQWISNFIWRIPCKCMQFCSRLSTGTDSDLSFFFMQNLLKTRNYPEVGFERDLRSIPVENLEQKVEKISNKTGIVLISDGFCRFVFLVFWTFGFLDFWFPMFIDLLASSLIFLGPQGWIFWGFRFIFFVAI